MDVLIRQAHPGPEVPAYKTLEQKANDAEKFKREDGVLYPVLFDDVEGTVHQVYGGLADPTYLIDADGRVAFYCMWTHAPTLHEAVEELINQGGRGVVKGGIHRTPHLAATITDGWRGLRRGLPQSFIELELSAPGMASLPWLGHQLKPLLAPVTLRAKPLPPSAKIALAAGGIGLLALGTHTAKSFINERNNKLRKGEEKKMKLRKLSEQVMVITGATSGIGLTTARMAAEEGAQLLLVARNEQALRELTDEINNGGGRAIYHAADVADEGSLREAAQKAMNEFGRIDTWVNNAGGSMYGRIMDVSVDDLRRVFETNVWGVVYGSRIAVEHMRDMGGALINVGSEVSDAPVPLQGIYSSSKHAVKGFTDALRMELEADAMPISVTLIKPTAIHTPFPENAKNYLPYEPQLPPPVYAPDLVAEAILYCAENPTRDFFIGEMAKLHSSFAINAPRLYDTMNEKMIDSMQNSGEPSVINRRDGLHQTNSRLNERGSSQRFVLEESLYQRAKIHPYLTTGLLVGSGLAVAALVGSRMMKTDGYERDLNKRNFRTNKGRRFMATQNMNIREHMEVVGSDGAHIGTVDKLEGDQIKLTKDDSDDGRHHRISMNMVDSVDQNKIKLNQTAYVTRSSWQGGITDSDSDLMRKTSSSSGFDRSNAGGM